MPLGRVLIIEDQEQVAALLRDILADLGYESQSISSPTHALRLIAVYRPDVILLDVWTPELSNGNVLALLRRDHPDTPVVIVTAHRDEDFARELLQRGALDYVRRPFDVKALARILEAAISRRR
jgi:DNA-binding NtrC family response regulator